MTAKPEREVDARLADWVDGRLSERDRERFVAELRVSPQLRKDLEDYERTVASLRAALQAPIRPVQIADRVLAAITAGNQGGGAGLRWRRSFVWSLSSAAALLVLALLVNAWSPTPKTDTTAALDKVTKLEADKEKRSSDDLRKAAKDERVVREQVEEDAFAERLRADAGNPAAPTAPTTLPPPAAPAPAAAAPTEVATAAHRAAAEGNEPTPGAAVAQEKPQAPVPKVAPVQDPATSLSGGVDKRAAGGGGEQARSPAPAERERGISLAAGEQLPIIIVRGGAIASHSRLQDGTPAPSGPGTAGSGGRVAPDPASRAPSGSEAQDTGVALRKAAEATELPLQLDVFFKRQMTVAGDADTGGEAWSAGGVQFTPLPAANLLALGAARKETEAKAQSEFGKERRGEGASKDDAVRPVERSWLVEGSKEELELVMGQLARFVQSGDMKLTKGETSEAILPPRSAPVGAAVPADRGAAARALPRFRLVLRFSAQPR